MNAAAGFLTRQEVARAASIWPELEREEQAELAALDPVLWGLYASPPGGFLTPDHICYLGEVLQRVSAGELTRVAISLPPQHGKSTFVSKYYPTWHLGSHPTDRVLLCSYGQELTVGWSGAARDLLTEHGPAVFDVDTWARAKRTNWDAFRSGRRTGGSMRGIGKGGGATGYAVDLAVCDDLVKGSAEVASQSQRDSLYAWFESAILTRARRLIVMATRWHTDDLIGRLKKKQAQGEVGEPWLFINIPAVAEADDPLGRAPGTPLWLGNPLAHGDPLWYEKKRREVGPYVWNALYQGRPTPPDGAIFKSHWFSYFEEKDGYLTSLGSRVRLDSLFKFVTLDPAFSKKTSADHVAAGAWALDLDNNRLYLLEVVRDRLRPTETIAALRGLMSRHGVELCFAERNNLQEKSMQLIRKAIPMREFQTNTDKVARAMPATAHFADGRLLFRRAAPWVADLEAELQVFSPDADEDDQVDMVSHAVTVANDFAVDGSPPGAPEERQEDEDAPRGAFHAPRRPR